MKKSVNVNVDFLFGVVMTVICVALLINAGGMRAEVRLMPAGALIVMLITSVGILFKSAFAKIETGVSGADLMKGVALPGGITFAAVFLIPWLGFYLAVFALTLASLLLQDKLSAEKTNPVFKRILWYVIFSLLVTALMYAVFNITFNLRTPRGFLGF